MTTLPDFEDDARDAILDKMEDELYAGPDNIAFRYLRAANQNFEEYASRHGYDIGAIPASGRVENTSRTNQTVSATIRWSHYLTLLFEYGVDPHTITGDLAFAWPSPPEGTRPEGAPSYVETDSVNWGSVTGGIPESRSIRGARSFIRLELEGEVTL